MEKFETMQNFLSIQNALVQNRTMEKFETMQNFLSIQNALVQKIGRISVGPYMAIKAAKTTALTPTNKCALLVDSKVPLPMTILLKPHLIIRCRTMHEDHLNGITHSNACMTPLASGNK